jgi:GntR family transcriptional repressor for pyruvate dehydrogenase complex
MELFSGIKKLRVHEQIVERVKDLIVKGDLNPGDRLPSERVLAETFKVSRNSVRDALLTLQLMGLVECRHGDGVYITSVTPESLVAPLAAIVATKKGLIAELMDARKVLEPPIARFAAKRATPDDVEEMERALQEQERNARDGGPVGESDSAFHYAIALATKNEVVVLVINHIVDLLKESRADWSDERIRASIEGHRKILSAIKRHDENEARDAMLAHLQEIDATIGGGEGT